MPKSITKFTIPVVSLGFIVVFVCGCAAKSDSSAQSESSDTPDWQTGGATPEEAIKGFFSALSDADPEQAGLFLVAPDKMKKYCRIQAKVSLAFKQLGDAGEEEFGEEGKILRQPLPATSALARLNQVQPIVDGDRATWSSNPNAPMKLIRRNGLWKIDLYSSFKTKERLNMNNAFMDNVANSITSVADEIRGGQIESVAQARAEIQKRRESMDQRLEAQFRKK